MRALAAAVLLAGCGHVGFDPAGEGAPAAAGCPAFATFCDDFESGNYSKWPTTGISPGGSLAVQTTFVHGGHFALDATMPAAASGADAAVELPLVAQATGTLAVRQWIYAPQQLTAFDAVMILWDNTRTNFINVTVDSNQHWDSSAYIGSGSVIDHGSTVAAPPGTWICVELDVSFDSKTFELFVDDTSALALPLDDPMARFSLLSDGVARASAGGARVIVDDVVIAPQHIGCS